MLPTAKALAAIPPANTMPRIEPPVLQFQPATARLDGSC